MMKDCSLGKQHEGTSPWYVKRMAMDAKVAACGSGIIPVSADIGAGAGDFTRELVHVSHRALMLEFNRPGAVPEGAEFLAADLNTRWPVDDQAIDFGFALEVVEHLENPRHFMREFKRILRPGGFGFLTTPNNHSWASKATFLLKGQHRRFQDASYPAHITPLLQCDLRRIAAECELETLRWIYSNADVLPRLHWAVRLPGRAFSDIIGLLFRRGAS